jgi:glutamine amidotransferase
MAIGIVDYGAGNLRSVQKAFSHLRVENAVINEPGGLGGVDRLVLPGVGSFGHAAVHLRAAGFLEPLKGWIAADRPFLGICLGMQLLFDGSEESPGVEGLGIFAGICRRFLKGKSPQIGWNDILNVRPVSLLEGIAAGTHFYFVHGFYVAAESPDIVAAETEYGTVYPSIVGRGRVWAVQFHPEKSGEAGLRLLSNWGRQC